jgi:hypothetical protein
MGNPSATANADKSVSDKQPDQGSPSQSSGFGKRQLLRLPSGRRMGAYLGLLLLIPALIGALYVYVRLHWSYADGDRSGLLQKFSRKGWICKTHEGELLLSIGPGQPGAAPHIWEFTVRDEDMANQVNAALGHKVVLHYAQHPGVPTSCFGDTEYFVDGVRILE